MTVNKGEKHNRTVLYKKANKQKVNENKLNQESRSPDNEPELCQPTPPSHGLWRC